MLRFQVVLLLAVLIPISLFAQDDQWYLDTFMSSSDGNQTLRDKTFLHPVGEWFNGTLVFDGGIEF